MRLDVDTKVGRHSKRKFEMFIGLVRKVAESDYQLCHACPLVSMQQLSSCQNAFYEILRRRLSLKCVQKIQVSLKYNISGILHEDLRTLSYRAQFFLKLKKFRIKFVEKIKTHFISIRLLPNIEPFIQRLRTIRQRLMGHRCSAK